MNHHDSPEGLMLEATRGSLGVLAVILEGPAGAAPLFTFTRGGSAGDLLRQQVRLVRVWLFW